MNLDELAQKYGGSPVQTGTSRLDDLASKYGGSAVTETAAPPKDAGFFSNVGDLLVEGGKRAIGAAQISPSVISGDVGEDQAKVLAEQLAMKPSVQPKELIEAQTAFKDEAEAFEKADGFIESVGPFADFLLEFGKQVLTNPKGAVYLTAQSAANMAPQIAGMIAGGKAGAVVGSVGGPGGSAIGAGVGAVGGGFAAGVPLEIGSEFIGRISQELSERGLPPTEENITALLRDKTVVDKAISDARTKGVTTAAIDSLMTVGAGKFASGARRSAIDAARKEMGVAADAAKIAARADAILKTRTLGQKGARVAGAVGIETAGGGISEAAGQAAAYGEVDLEDVGAEMLGELGGSTLSVPAAAYSTTQDLLRSKARKDAAAIIADEEKSRVPPVVDQESPPITPVVESEPVAPAVPVAPIAPIEPAIVQPVKPDLPPAPAPEVEAEAEAEPLKVASEWDNDYSENLPPEAGSFFQNRDRSAPASVGQMQSIAANPDYSRLGVGRDFGSGAPVVISDSQISEDRFGKVSYATASDGTRIPVRYAVVEGNEITPSNTSDGTKNVEYGDLSVPTIRPIAGNGRIAGLRAAYSQGTAENYKREFLEDVEHGINPAVLSGLKNPVLVRVMPKSRVTQNIADISNISGTLRLSPVESAKNDITRVNLNGLSFNDDGSPNTNTLIQFVRSMPKDEQGELIDAKGMPNTKAIDRLNNAIFYKAYGSDNLIELYAQAVDPEAKAVLNALAKAASKMAALEGAGDYDIRSSVLDAAEMAVNARRSGQKLKDYAQQGVLGADPYALKVLDMFADNSRSAKRMGEALDRLATKAAEQANSSDSDMFGNVPKLPKDDVYKAMASEPEVGTDLFTPPAEPVAPAVREPEAIPEPALPTIKEPEADDAPEPSAPVYDKAENPEFAINKSPEVIAKEIQNKTVEELAQWAVANAPNEAAKSIAELVLNRVSELTKKNVFPEKVRVVNDDKRWKKGTRGKVSLISVKKYGFNMKMGFNGLSGGVADRQTGTRYSTILHELIHAATVAQIFYAPNSKSVNDLKVLFKTVERQLASDKAAGKTNYAIGSIARQSNIMQDPAELMAWGLTDSKFQQVLSEIKVGNKTAFQKLVEIVRQSLGLSKDYESALDSLVRITSEMAGSSLTDVEADMKPSGIPLKGIKTKGKRIILPESDGKAAAMRVAEEQLPEVPAGKTRVYRGEYSGPKKELPEWLKITQKESGQLDAQGRWWTESFDVAKWYAEDAGPDGGVVYQDIPSSVVEDSRVKGSSVERFSRAPEEELFLPMEYVGRGKLTPAREPVKSRSPEQQQDDVDIRYQREEEPQPGQPKPSRQNIFGEPVLGTWSITVDPKMEVQDGIIYKLLDKNVDVKRIIEAVKETGKEIASKWNPYLQEELYHGRTATASKDFQNDEWLPLLKDMQEKDVTVGELEKYLLNRHAEAYNNFVAKRNPTRPEMQDGGSSVTTENAQKYLAGLSENQKQKFEALAKRVDAITKGTRKLLADTGYEKAETIDAWEETFPNYVPLMREEMGFDYNFGSFGTGRGFDVRRDFSRSAMGSKRNVVDIISNVISARNNAISLTEKNRVAQAVYGLALEAPNPDFWMAINPEAEKIPQDALDELLSMGLDDEAVNFLMKEPKQRVLDPKKNEVMSRINTKLRENDYVLATRVNGERRYVFFNQQDPRAERAARALKNLDAQDLGTAMGIIAKVTRWMAAVNTQYNPIFGPYNFLRDAQAAALQLSTTELAGQQAEVSKEIIPSLRVIYLSLRKSRKGKKVDGDLAKLWKEFQQEGGQTGFKDNFSRTQDRSEALVNEMEKLSEGKAKAGARAVFDWLSDYNDSLENAVRLAAYKVAKKKFAGEGFSDSEAKQKAASLAKNLTVNFNRKGDVAIQMGALYAFFNAAMQGSARMIETLRGPTGKKIMAGGLMLGSMQALLLAGAGFDDEDPPEFVRAKNIIIPTGGGNYIAIPMPLGYHVIPGVSRILTEWAISGFDDTARRTTDLFGLFLDAFNPIGNSGWSVQTVTPTVLDPFVALGENKDFTGKPISRNDLFSLRPTPGYTRAREGANWFSMQLSEFLNFASGGTKYQKGMFSPTPEQIEYLAGQAFGGIGRESMKLATTIEKTITGEELPIYKIPLYGRFVGETKGSAAESSRFYKNIERLNGMDLEIKGRRENREPTRDFMLDNPEARLLPMANKTYKAIQALRKRRTQLLERNASREAVQRVEAAITKRMKILNDRVKSIKDK